MAGRIDGRYETRYGEIIKGNEGNHKRAVRFDHSPNGYIGITAFELFDRVSDRVLLSPAQAKALIAFIRTRGRSPRRGLSGASS